MRSVPMAPPSIDSALQPNNRIATEIAAQSSREEPGRPRGGGRACGRRGARRRREIGYVTARARKAPHTCHTRSKHPPGDGYTAGVAAGTPPRVKRTTATK